MFNCVVIGLTGPTGAGKTTVSRIFEENGCAVIECDKLARDAVTEKDCIENLCKAFGDDIIENGTLNRALVAKRAFSSDETAKLLNSITHPVILRLLKEDIEEAENNYKAVIIDAPLLFEASLETWCDKVVSVIAPYEIRIKRIMQRDNISEEAALLRMERQKDDKYYTDKSDYVIDGTSDNTKEDVMKILKDLQVVI